MYHAQRMGVFVRWSPSTVAPLALLAALLSARLATAQFTQVDPGLPKYPVPCVVPGDYDGDGDPDLLVAGVGKQDVAFTTLFRNTGGTFADSGISLLGLARASAAWGDFDNDGDLDLAMTGLTSAQVPTTRIYRNDRGTFSVVPGAFTGVFAGNVAWADIDGDHDLDLLVTGVTGQNPGAPAATRLYRNDAGVFTSVPHPFPDCYVGSVAFGDYDNDGDPDVIITGAGATGALFAAIWRNDGGTFTDIGAAIPGLDLGFAAWGDYDNDGDLDLLFGGNASTGFVASIYRNDGGTFTDANAGLLSLIWASGAWGDYDRDGDLDVMTMGYDPVTQLPRSILYRNDGGAFVDSGFAFQGLYLGTLSWLDHDGDGDPDLVMAGNSAGADHLFIERNDTPSTPRWVDLGLALAGTNGTPKLAGSGNLVANTPMVLALTNVLANAPAFLVVGFANLSAPFKGGTLVPSLNLTLALTTGRSGQIVLPATWPAGIPVNFAVYFQYWIKDPGGPLGFAGSNGLKGIAH